MDVKLEYRNSPSGPSSNPCFETTVYRPSVTTPPTTKRYENNSLRIIIILRDFVIPKSSGKKDILQDLRANNIIFVNMIISDFCK